MSDFEKLKKLLKSEQWPFAVHPDLICLDNEKDKTERGSSIVEFVLEKKGKLLDFGCGEGHVSEVYKEKTKEVSVGYDIKAQWKNNGKALLTSDWNEVKKNGPYDQILLYDVVDHMEGNPADMLKILPNVCTTETKILIRCHPWCSRHGVHYYRKINKAFMHLVFSNDELKELGCEIQKTQKVIHPLVNYSKWIKESGLKMVSKDIVRSYVEPFFSKTPEIARKIRSHWATSKDANAKRWPEFQLQQSFIDYVLKI